MLNYGILGNIPKPFHDIFLFIFEIKYKKNRKWCLIHEKPKERKENKGETLARMHPHFGYKTATLVLFLVLSSSSIFIFRYLK
jgi:hypothetical protein